jgi:hypothetical protein
MIGLRIGGGGWRVGGGFSGGREGEREGGLVR